jgi:hypothetical protein
MIIPVLRTGALVLLLSLLTAACSLEKISKPHDNGRVKFMLRSARATDCTESCKSMVLSVTAVSDSSVLYCVPGEYFGGDAGESVAIFPAGSGEPVMQSTPLRHEASVWSADIAGRLSYTRARPNIVLQPHKKFSWDAVVDDRFDFKKGDAEVELLVIAYPCDEAGQKSSDLIRERLRAVLTY